MVKKLRRLFSKIYDYIFYRAYIEEVFIEFFLLIYALARIFYWDDWVYINLVLVDLGLCLVKLLPIPGVRRFFTVALMRESSKSNSFIYYAVANILLLFILLLGLFVLGETFTLVLSLVFRALLFFEKERVQFVLVIEGIEETASLGMPQMETHLAEKASIKALVQLGNIRDGLSDAVEERMKSEKMKTDLITNISHDLKTPLTSIINYTDILSSKETMDEEAKNYIRILGRNSERLKSLVINLIDASKTGSGNVQVEKVVIDFNELLSQVFGDFESDLTAKGLEFIYNSDSDYAQIYTDPEVLGRILSNTLSNACKYALENTRIYAKLIQDQSKYYFSMKNVSKNRLGISADELMQQFVRGEKSRTTEGSGLGLHIAKNLVEALGGEFRIVIDGDYFQVFIELNKE